MTALLFVSIVFGCFALLMFIDRGYPSTCLQFANWLQRRANAMQRHAEQSCIRQRARYRALKAEASAIRMASACLEFRVKPTDLEFIESRKFEAEEQVNA